MNLMTINTPGQDLPEPREDKLQTSCSLPATTQQQVTGTPAAEKAAQQKASFVLETWETAKSQKISCRDAAQLVALNREHFSELISAGRNSTNLLEGIKAFHNFQKWSRRLGKAEGTKTPDASNWRALLPRVKNSRQYVRQGDPRFWEILANVYEHPNKLGLRYAYDLTCLTFRDHPDVEAPTFPQVRYYYEQHVDQKAVLVAREGEDWYKSHMVDYVNREAPAPDDCWVGDHHIFDAAVRVWDPDRGQWKAVRPWLTAWLDWGSLTFIGTSIRVISPNRDVIERSFREAIQKNDGHAPRSIYIDNGKDYRAKGFSRPATDTDGARVKSICEALNVRVQMAQPYNARAKIIERTFGIVCCQFSKLWPSYRGSTPKDRPATADAIWKTPEKLPTLDEFAAAFEKWLAVYYHSNPSTGKTLKGKSPLEIRSGIKRLTPPVEPARLYKAFLRELPRARVILPGGSIRAFNREYRSEELYTLLGQVDKVRVKVDADDVDCVWIYTLDGVEVGPAYAKPQIPGLIEPEDTKSIEMLREEQSLQARQLKRAKAASADQRALKSWRKASALPVHETGFLEDSPAPVLPPRKKRLPDVPASSPEDIQEMDAFLQEDVQATLAAREDVEDDSDDMAILAELEREQLIAVGERGDD